MSSEALAKKILTTRLFGPLNLEQLTSLLERAPLHTAPAGDIIIKAGKPPENHLLLLEGEVEVQRTWSVPGGENDKSYTWTLKPYDGEADFGFLSAASNRLRVRAVSDIRYLLIDADIVDDMVGWNQQFADLYEDDPLLRHRINLAMQTSLFNKLPMEHFKSAFERLSSREVQVGEIIMSQGDEGDAYYIIDEGEAEIVRIDPLTDKVQRTLLLGAGDAVGEEALLQGGFRNATVTMTTPGKLLVLMKQDFDELVKSSILNEVDAEEAYRQLINGEKELIDCRYDMEYEESRIPNSNLVPLDQIRFHAKALNPGKSYIVYCRSGRRSKAATFLLRERNIDAVSLSGGIKNWPYAVDTSKVDLS